MRDDLLKSFAEIGFPRSEAGDILVIQSSYVWLAFSAGLSGKKDGPQIFINALLDVIGKNGTLVMPAFNFNRWTESHYFDLKETPSDVGLIPEVFRLMPGVRRTKHPIHCLSVFGKLQNELCSMEYEHSFGEDSVYAKLLEYDALYCTLGLGLERPFLPVHYTEARMKVPYRRRKNFAGIYVDESGKASLRTYCFDVREGDRTPPTDFTHGMQFERGSVKKHSACGVDLYYSRGKEYDRDMAAIIRERPELFR